MNQVPARRSWPVCSSGTADPRRLHRAWSYAPAISLSSGHDELTNDSSFPSKFLAKRKVESRAPATGSAETTLAYLPPGETEP